MSATRKMKMLLLACSLVFFTSNDSLGSKSSDFKAEIESRIRAYKKWLRSRPPRSYFDKKIPEFRAVVVLGVKVVPYLIRAIEKGDSDKNALSVLIDEITKRKFTMEELFNKGDIRKRTDVLIEWWKHGRNEDIKRFKILNDRLLKSIEKGNVKEARKTKKDIQNLGVLVLPHIIDRIGRGDVELIECVSVLTGGEISRDASKKGVLDWWEKNGERFKLGSLEP